MTKFLFLTLLLMLFVLPARAEVYPVANAPTKNTEKNGVVEIERRYAFTRDKAPANHAIKEIAVLTIAPGAATSYHKHTGNEDAYIIISGTGTFKDNDGKDYPVGPGDMTVVRDGESHSLSNTGKVPLKFAAVIASQK